MASGVEMKSSEGHGPATLPKPTKKRGRYGKFQASIKVHGRTKYLGMFTDELRAAQAYDAVAHKHFGVFALSNFQLNNLASEEYLP